MRGLVYWVKVVWIQLGMGGNSQTVSWKKNVFFKVNNRPTFTQPGSEVNVSRKLLRLSFNVDKEKGVHATLLIVFVPSKGLAIKIPYLKLSRRPLFDRADHLRVFRVGPEQIPRLFKIYLIKSAQTLGGYIFQTWPAPRSRWSPWASSPSRSSRPPPGTPSPWVSGLLLGSPAQLKWEYNVPISDPTWCMMQWLTNQPGQLPILEISDVLRSNQGVQVMVIRLESGNVHRVRIHG